MGMAFVRIPVGEFMMGSEEDPAELARAFPELPAERFTKLGDEQPLHRVRITRPFWMGQHEVAVGQFRRRYGPHTGHRGGEQSVGVGQRMARSELALPMCVNCTSR